MVFLWGVPACKTFLGGGEPGCPNCLAGIRQVDVRGSAPAQRCVSRRPGGRRLARPRPRRPARAGASTTSTGSRPPARASFWRPCFRPSGCEFRRGSSGASSAARCSASAGRCSTIACMLALAFTTKYSGGDATLGLAFTRTGWLYPFFAPMLGWLGVALTGSDTSSQRPVRQPSANHRRAIAFESGADRGQQQHGRGDGQDDRRPKHCRGGRGHRAIRRRGPHPAIRLLPQPCSGRPRRSPDPRTSVLAAVDDPHCAIAGGRALAPPLWRDEE